MSELGPILAGHGEYLVPLAGAWLSLSFSAPSQLFFFFFLSFPVTVIKYADKSNLRGREFISAQNSKLQTIIVEDVPGAGAWGCWLCVPLSSPFHPLPLLSLALSARPSLLLCPVPQFCPLLASPVLLALPSMLISLYFLSPEPSWTVTFLPSASGGTLLPKSS